MNSHRPKRAHRMELMHCKILGLVHATDIMMAVHFYNGSIDTLTMMEVSCGQLLISGCVSRGWLMWSQAV